jgi:hypothetical protein
MVPVALFAPVHPVMVLVATAYVAVCAAVSLAPAIRALSRP